MPFVPAAPESSHAAAWWLLLPDPAVEAAVAAAVNPDGLVHVEGPPVAAACSTAHARMVPPAAVVVIAGCVYAVVALEYWVMAWAWTGVAGSNVPEAYTRTRAVTRDDAPNVTDTEEDASPPTAIFRSSSDDVAPDAVVSCTMVYPAGVVMLVFALVANLTRIRSFAAVVAGMVTATVVTPCPFAAAVAFGAGKTPPPHC